MGYSSDQVIKIIDSQAGDINSVVINDVTSVYLSELTRRKTLFDEYLGIVPIMSRQFTNTYRINNKLRNNWRRFITTQGVGYFLGTPVSYTVEESGYDEKVYEAITDEIDKFLKRNNISDQDAEIAEHASICGVGYRLLYIDTDGKERSLIVKPYEAFVIKNATLDLPEFGVITYLLSYANYKNDTVLRRRVEFYDKYNVYYFIQTDAGYNLEDVKPHMFAGTMPLIEFDNNNIQQGDWETQRELIDSYDFLESNIANEIDENTIAYMIFKGVALTQAEAEVAMKSRTIFLPDKEQSIEYLTKSTSAEFIENHKKTLEKNILTFSSAVDMSDEKFSGGGQSGESRKWKLTQLETKTKMKERKFTKSLRHMFMVLCQAWNKKEIPLDYMDVEFQFTRSLPLELNDAATANSALVGTISDKTRLGLLPFIEDPESEMEQMKLEAQEKNVMQIDMIQLPVEGAGNGTMNNPVDIEEQDDMEDIANSNQE